ncbi:MAG: hypothetical protein HQL73_09755 [Magnetococcales bacterium]|nr:hypothetical protein [Magnetococcales bacterium]
MVLLASSVELMSYLVVKYILPSGLFSGYVPKETFSIRGFTERVNDDRIITMKQNHYVELIKENWTIQTDGERLRIPPGNTLHDIRSNQPKFIFIGDSVPFGWGVNAENSLPFLFSEKRKELIVLNASIPSYSLGQAVARLRSEFVNLTHLSYIYLQIYDPASQYGLFGSRWEENDNWTTMMIRYTNLCYIPGTSFFYFSNFFKVANILFQRCPIAPGVESDQRYRSYLRKQLHEAAEISHRSNAILIVAPVTIPRNASALDIRSHAHRRAINIINKIMLDGAEKYKYKFFDTRQILTEDDDFIDLCCHLSKKGSEKVAHALSEYVSH